MFERTVVAGVLGFGLAIPVLAAAAAVARLGPPGGALPWVIGGLLAALALGVAWQLRRRLPVSLVGAARRHPVRAGLWAVLALLALLQLGRLGAFMADPANTFGSAFPEPGLTAHMCMTAYVRAAELVRDGDPNPYHERHWPAFRFRGEQKEEVTSTVVELGPRVDDPYEYPPQFLLLPRLALAVSNNFLAIRAVWFALQCLAFLAVALALAAFIGGREGLIVGLLIPAAVASLPFLVNLQFGQAHLLTFALSMAALVCFGRGRAAVGGLLLGAAVVFKLFPGLLIVYLMARRRWREVGWTVGACVAITLLAAVVIGLDPFVEFFRYQLPRISSGEAFSFFRREWFYISRNLGVSGLVYKLEVLGVPGMGDGIAHGLGWVYTVFLLALVVRAARQPERAPLDEALLWLALLCLGSLRSPLVPGIYGSFGALWLLMLLASRAQRPVHGVLIVLAFFVITGGPPLPSAAVDIALAFLGQALMVAVALYALRWRAAGESASRPALSTGPA